MDISQTRYKAGDISEDDFLKIKLQLLQFQTRRFAGETCQGAGAGRAAAAPRIPIGACGLRCRRRIRLSAGATEARRPAGKGASANGPISRRVAKRDRGEEPVRTGEGKRKAGRTGTANYSHTGGLNTLSTVRASMDLPIFDRNQGEIARTKYAIDQAQELERAASEQVMTDVLDAYEDGLQNNERSSRSTPPAISTKRSRIATSANTPTSAAPRACSIFSTPSAATARRNSPTGRRSLLICTALEQLREAVGTRSLP